MKVVSWLDLNDEERASVLTRPLIAQDQSIEESVRGILADVKSQKDNAVQKYTQKFDGVSLDKLEIVDENTDLDPAICQAIDIAYENIYRFHEKQGAQEYQIDTMNGVACKRIVRPIEKVGLYVPGGSAPLVSTTLMLGVPMQIAGCSEPILCTPCDKEGKVNPYILYVANKCGIKKIFRIGGAQAIAAMAYGTESIPKVDKIYGPGNAYVTEAKMQVVRDAKGAAIDMPAGPSEVCVIIDETTNPSFAAADLLSQAEHDTLSQVLLIGLSKDIVLAVQEEVTKQLELLPRKDIAREALENSVVVIVQDMNEAISVSNQYAPEHLILCFDEADGVLSSIQNAGSVFVGQYTPESAGDYASGTNHVLPTYGYARMYSGLSVEAFQKTMTVQNISKEGIQALGPSVETLAELEGLNAHARAISIRLESLS